MLTVRRTVLHLGIEFYLFVFHSGMKDRGSMCKFRNARNTFRNLHVDPLSFTPYIYTLNCPVLAMKYPFSNTQQGGIQNIFWNRRLIPHGNRFIEEWLSKFFLCS